MNLILNNLRIVSPFSEQEYIETGHIAIEDGIITDISSQFIPALKDGESIDMKGKTVLPGLINAHSHLYSSLALGMPSPQRQPKNFVQILEEIWWKLDVGLDENSAKASFESGLLDCLLNGCTTIVDHHASPKYVEGSLDLLVETAENFGVNIGVCFECSDRNGEENFKAEVAENVRTLEKYQDSPNVAPLFGLHASFTLSDRSLEEIAGIMEKHPKWGIHIHVAEDFADQQDATDRGYESVIQRLDSYKLLNQQSHIVHGIHMTSRDVRILEAKGCSLIHNPTSNANNQVGILPSDVINGLGAGLGTDGMQNNMLTEMKEGVLIRSASTEHAVDYPRLLFENNPAIVSKMFHQNLGRIEVGAQADLVFYDYDSRTEIKKNNILSHILFGFDKPTDVMTQGKFRVQNGAALTINIPEVQEQAVNQSRELWKAMQKL